MGARFLRGLPSFLRHPVGLDEARTILRRRLERRQDDFLTLVGSAVYGQADSPYRKLLEITGCEYGDLEYLVRRTGVEGALQALYQSGVYLTVEEFKGRRPVVRGGRMVAVEPGRLRNPAAAVHLLAQSSGSRGWPTTVPIDLALIRDRSVNLRLTFETRGGRDWVHALWGIPGGGYLLRLLEYSGFGAPPARWFSQVDPNAPGLHPRFRWSARALRWGSALARMPLPLPEYVPLDDPAPIARWMVSVLQDGRIPHLHTFSSPAVRLCQAATVAGLNLRGARFTITGEPVTAARLGVIRGSGAEAAPRYGTAECPLIGYGCAMPDAPDDLHLFHDLYALIQPGAGGATDELRPSTLLISSLRPSAPLVLLNVSLGDQGAMLQRACGCPLEAIGWSTHLHTIRSYEKLTAGGMTFLDTDVIHVLDELLPARFGGTPTDYQLLEEEDDDGRPRLRLLVRPAVGPLDAQAVVDAFLAGIGGGSGIERVMALQWRQADLLTVERRPPLATPTGKILHLHQRRREVSS